MLGNDRPVEGQRLTSIIEQRCPDARSFLRGFSIFCFPRPIHNFMASRMEKSGGGGSTGDSIHNSYWAILLMIVFLDAPINSSSSLAYHKTAPSGETAGSKRSFAMRIIAATWSSWGSGAVFTKSQCGPTA